MQIHELNTKELTNPAYVPFDDGTDTYKAEFHQIIDDAVEAAYTDANLSGGIVNYTSGDDASPSSWSSVSVLTTGLTLKTLFERISTMIKNVRYIWNKIGTTSMGTTATTITGAIAEHEEDITALSGKFTYQNVTVTTGTTTYDGTRAYSNFDIPTDKGTLIGMYIYSVQSNLGAYAIRIDDSTGRVYTHATSTTVTIRMLFMA